jgi:hypothetical protein
MMIAALMYDQVMVDDGSWHGFAGPGGSLQGRWRPGQLPGITGFQTAKRRSQSHENPFSLAVALPNSSGSFETIIQSSTSVFWEATFEPIKSELPKAFPWLQFVTYDLLDDDKQTVSEMAHQDADDVVLPRLISDPFSRSLVISGANHSLLLGARMGAAVSLDALHRDVLAVRLARGQAWPVYGERALSILLPEVDRLSWDEIDAARRLRGLSALRAVLADVEEAAWTSAHGEEEFALVVRDQYLARVQIEIQKLQPSLKTIASGAAISVALGLVTGPFAPAVGLAGAAAATAGDALCKRVTYERSWMAAAEKVRRVIAHE